MEYNETDKREGFKRQQLQRGRPDEYDESYISRKHEMRRQGRRMRKPPVLLILLGATVIAFAVVLGYAATHGARGDAQRPAFEDSSPVQAEINRLDWIEPMPLTVNEFSRPGTPLREVTGIVIHNIGNPGTTAEQNRNFFEKLATTEETSASSNFIVCLDGSVVQCIPVDEVAYASNFRNEDTLSIEVCHPDDSGRFGEDTYASVVRLAAWLCDRYGLSTDDILRHADVYDKECPRYYVENEDAWEALKADIKAQMG